MILLFVGDYSIPNKNFTYKGSYISLVEGSASAGRHQASSAAG